MAFHHVVMFRWNEGVDADHVDRLVAWLGRLPGEIPEVKGYRYGPDAGVNTGNYDFAVTADFDDVDGYLVYRDHPFHQELIQAMIVGHIAERAAAQFET